MERSSGGPSRNHQQQPWMNTGSSYHHHHEYSLWWPPRSYTCSFCQREFRSAQALGGHMNVHRRDRARLRHYSPPRDPAPFCSTNPNPNVPNLNLSPPPPPPPVPPPSTASDLAKQLSPSLVAPYTFTSQIPSPPGRVGPKAFSVGPFQSRYNESKSMEAVKHAALIRGEEFETGIVEEDLLVGRARKKAAWTGPGVCSAEEDLDLELRLGYT